MIKTVKKIVILDNNFWKVCNNDVIFDNKVKGKYLSLKSKAESGVAVLPIDKEGNIYIQDEYRYGIENFMTHIVLGGKNENETLEEAALKELEDEIGLSTNNLIPFGYFQEMVSVMDHKLYLFVAVDVFEKNKKNERRF